MYADVELQEVSCRCPDNRYITKASYLVQKVLNYIRLEFKSQPATINVRNKKITKFKSSYKWAVDDVHFVELVYGLIESKSIENENGSTKINEFAEHLGEFFGVDLRNSHDTYSSTIKRRNKENRAYFLNTLAYVLNKKMNHEDKVPPPELPAGHARTLFDEV